MWKVAFKIRDNSIQASSIYAGPSVCAWSNSTGLKNRFKMAQKANVKLDMATYWFNTVMYKYLIMK